MTERAPESALRHPLERQHQRHAAHGCGVARCAAPDAMRRAGGHCALIGVAVHARRRHRLAEAIAAARAAIWRCSRSVAHYARNVLSLPVYLEQVESRFPI
jgi:hypothetical protein